MLRVKLTDKWISTRRLPTSGREEIADLFMPGLYLRIGASGVKSFSVVARADRVRRYSLGRYPSLSLADARDKTRQLMRELASGGQRTSFGSLTLADLTGQYVELHLKRNVSSWLNVERSLTRKVPANLTSRRAGSITKSEIVALLDTIVEHGAPHAAVTLLKNLKSMYGWAIDRDLLAINPCDGIRPPVKTTSRDRVLSDQEVGAVIRACASVPAPFGDMILMLFHTGARRNEIANIRALDGLPGMSRVLKDMAQPKEFEPTVHTLHMAALFHRGGNPIDRFFDAKNDRIPDFLANIGPQATAVEAKKFTVSGPSARFSALGFKTMDRLRKEVLLPDAIFGQIFLVVKDPDIVPSFADLTTALRAAASNRGAEGYGETRAPTFNVFIYPPPANMSFDGITEIHWMARRADSEDQRVERLLNQANKQIKAYTSTKSPGVACISIRDSQDPLAIRNYIERKFNAGQYTSTTGVILHRSAANRGFGPRGPVDQVSFIGNPAAAVTLAPFQLRSFGLTVNMEEHLPATDTVACYCVAAVEGRFNGTPGGSLGISPITRLPLTSFE